MSQMKASSHYIAVIVRHARHLGLDVEQMLSDIGVPPELSNVEDKWIDNRYVTALVKRMWQETNDESFGFSPNPLRLGTWALACEFMLAAETLGDLYRKGEHVLSYLAPESIPVAIAMTEDTVSVLPRANMGESDPSHFMIEFMMIVWHRFPSWAIDEHIPLQKAFFSYPRPPHGQFYEEFFQCDVEFEHSDTGFSFSRKYLNKRIIRTRPELDEWLHNSPADLLYLPGRENSVKSLIVHELTQELELNRRFPAFESICTHLCMSPQVIRRRLGEEGTSYQNIKDSVRQDLAKQLLSSPEISISEISERTGFAEPAAFSRAFKKWTGTSPAGYRANRSPGILGS